jgi:hypothetical protein
MLDYLKPVALAVATFLPSIGCTTDNSSPNRSSQGADSSKVLPDSLNLEISTRLYGSKGYPTPYDGACLSPEHRNLIAAVNALVAARPYAVKEMILPEGSGESYRVRLEGPTETFTTFLRPPTDEQLSSPIKCAPNVSWPAVFVIGGKDLSKRGLIDIMQHLGGREVKREPLNSLSPDQLQNMLLEAAAEHRAVIFQSTTADALGENKRVDSIIFEPNKAYAAIKVDGAVTILDPERDIGLDDPNKGYRDGEAKVPSIDLYRFFKYVYIELDSPDLP